MALLSNTYPDPTLRGTPFCDSTVGAYKHSDPEKKGKKERREMKDRTRSGLNIMHLAQTLDIELTQIKAGKQIQTSFLFSHPLLSAESD